MVRAYEDKAWFPSSQLKHASSPFLLPTDLHRTSFSTVPTTEKSAHLSWEAPHKSHFPADPRLLASSPTATSGSSRPPSALSAHRSPCSVMSSPPKDTCTSPAGPAHLPAPASCPHHSHLSLGVQSNTFLLRPAATLPHKAPASGTATSAWIPSPPLHSHGTQEPSDSGLCISSSFTQVTGLPKPQAGPPKPLPPAPPAQPASPAGPLPKGQHSPPHSQPPLSQGRSPPAARHDPRPPEQRPRTWAGSAPAGSPSGRAWSSSRAMAARSLLAIPPTPRSRLPGPTAARDGSPGAPRARTRPRHSSIGRPARLSACH